MSSRRVPGHDPASCLACLAWGCGFHHGLCRPCWEFARRWPVDECGACHRRLPVKKGHCRLCWCQARLDRSAALGGRIGTYTMLLPHARLIRHHQLFLANMPAPRDLVGKPQQRRHGVGAGAPGIARKPPPPVAGPPRVDWIQPRLFDYGPRDYRRRIDLRSHPTLDNQWLAWALHLAHTHAEAHGFNSVVCEALNRALVMLLGDYTAGETIRFSDIHRALRERGNSAEHAAHVLQQMGVLDDDRTRAIDRWLDRKLDAIAPAIARHVHDWARTLIEGGPRAKPRHHKNVRLYVAALRPVLLDWSIRHEHLREITRDAILDQIQPLCGPNRQATMKALRSLFRWAKANGVVFRNPTGGIKLRRVERPIPQPLTQAEITPTVHAATAPHARLAIALAAVHAARHGDIIAMQLSDVDLGNRRLTVAGRTRPLDDLTRRALGDWLLYRRRRWPNTANTHLLISKESALHLGPVSHPWINRILRGLPATLERLRVDRHLDEAIISGGDPLHLAEIFGMDETTAIRYADAARQLLASSVEPDPPVHSEPSAPRNRERREVPVGSD
jgi:integrase